MDIYVGNIHYGLDDNSIRKLFEVFGLVTSVILLKDKAKNTSLGYGFVQMPNAIEATRAIDELHGRSIGGRNLVVKIAIPKDQKTYVDKPELGNKLIFTQKDKTQEQNTLANYSKNHTEDGYIKVNFKS